MIPIDAFTVGVENEGELRTAVGNNTINYIYLANDILMTSGITIDAGKASLVIDGEYPQGSGTVHALTDTNSTDYGQTIGVRGSSSITLTFRNMVIHGYNYYGVPYIIENIPPFIYTDDVTVIYENVSYNGPQMTYNRYGRTRYINCTITIQATGIAQSQEVGEVNRVELGGRTRMIHTSQTDNRAVFWFNNTAGTSSLTVLSGADVEIESIYSYFMYNIDGLIPAPVSYTLQSGAQFRLRASRGISLNQSHPVSAFLVQENASFHYIQTASNDSAASLYVGGALTVQQGARFYMQADSGTQPLIRFTSGANRSLNIENPLSFVLYSPNAAALNAQGTTTFSISGGQLNTWSAAKRPIEEAGGFDDVPELKWFKREYAQPVAFTGSFTGAATTATGNLEEADQPHPADSELHLHSARVLSAGDWPVLVNPAVDDGRPITGRTEPGANLIVEYEIGETEYSIVGAAEEDGSFSIDTSQEQPPTIPIGTDVVVWSNIPFLIKGTYTIVVGVGELMIESAPDQILFRPRPISFGPPLLPRLLPEEPVIIRDDRVDATRWELLATVSAPLRAVSGEILTDAVVFVQAEGAMPVALGEEPVVVFTGGPNVLSTSVFWPEREGILVRITDPVRSGAAYSTHVIWEVRAI